ncbi:hypothetical protein CPLU01_09522 [Colletotrichum plurivorum]|uniref:Uncharacterized protein n=1 Tax=Colletotrichum plurivorum TaxID=2175906 RepID=A0A8H6NAR2_9PEZI|nr:hypothetical protein CPLU01_09522 [Colletotrichum plurivorum]
MIVHCAIVKAFLAAGALGVAFAGTIQPTKAVSLGHEQQDLAVRHWPDHNCEDIVKRRIVPQVDCSYSFENCGFDNHLEYQIKIDPVGQSSEKWCEILNDKIRHFTKKDTTWLSCQRDYKHSDIGNGIWLRINIGWPWPEGEDFIEDVEAAVRFSMCFEHPVLTNWVNEGCYRSSVCKARYWVADKPDTDAQRLEISSNPDSERVVARDVTPDSTSTLVSYTPTTTWFVHSTDLDLPVASDVASNVASPVLPSSSGSVAFLAGDDEPFFVADVEGVADVAAAAATPPPGEDPDFTCAFVNPNKEWVVADCSHIYQKKGDRLKYTVDVWPTGQDPTKWCDQIMAGVRRDCAGGTEDGRYPIKSCKTDVHENGLGKGVHLEWEAKSWWTHDDNEGCTENAISASTCGVPVNFKKGGCYRS